MSSGNSAGGTDARDAGAREAASPRLRLARWIALLLLIVVGLFAFDDYGLGWDDGTSRAATGQVNWNFVTRGVSKTLLEGNEKYHGPAYELFLLAVEKALFLRDLRAIFLVRHLVMFLTFALAVVAFHDVARRLLARPWSALFAAATLVLSPRIFAESFVNSKDLAFLSLSILATWTLLCAWEKPTLLRLALHAFALAFLIDVRVLGVLHVPVTLGSFLVLALREAGAHPGERRAVWKRWGGRSALVAALGAGLVVLFWPVLWLGPWTHFRAALHEMGSYHWEGLVLYAGKRVKTTELPWHYLPLWIFVTTPLATTALFAIGALRQAGAALRGLFEPRTLLARLDPTALGWLAVSAYGFAPLFAVIVLHSVVYDGWRHVYCVYPFLVLFAARGLEFLLEPGLLPRMLGRVVLGFALASSGLVAVQMALLHPHQNVYFHEFAKNRWRPIGAHFELDYWGVCYRQGLEAVLALEPRPKRIRIAARNSACEMNFSILEAADRERLEFVASRDEADYYLSNFRVTGDAEPPDPPDVPAASPAGDTAGGATGPVKVHEIVAGGVPILAVWRMRP